MKNLKNYFYLALVVGLSAGVIAPVAHAEVFTTTLGETVETPDANLSIDIRANRADIRRGEKATYTLTVANASQTKIITTDLSLIFYNLDLNVGSIQPKQFTGRMSNLTGYPWNFFFKPFQLKPQEKKTITFTATVNPKAKLKERLRMAAVVQEAEFRNSELIQTDAVYLPLADGPVRSDQKIKSEDIAGIFKSIYGRVPTDGEKKYWIGRLKDKPTVDALKGAMAFQKVREKNSQVKGTTSAWPARFILDPNSETGGVVGKPMKITFSLQSMSTRSYDHININAEIPVNAKYREKIQFLGPATPSANTVIQEDKNVIWVGRELHPKETQKYSFLVQLKSGKVGEQVNGLALTAFSFNPYGNIAILDIPLSVTAKKNKKISEIKVVSSPSSMPIPKITEKDFRILDPDSLSSDRADQTITWYSSSALQKKYPAVKIELCPGKDFKGCVILDAVVENDGSHIINMPPIPRIGKWYLHLIGRDSQSKLRPNVSAARLVVLHQ